MKVIKKRWEFSKPNLQILYDIDTPRFSNGTAGKIISYLSKRYPLGNQITFWYEDPDERRDFEMKFYSKEEFEQIMFDIPTVNGGHRYLVYISLVLERNGMDWVGLTFGEFWDVKIHTMVNCSSYADLIELDEYLSKLWGNADFENEPSARSIKYVNQFSVKHLTDEATDEEDIDANMRRVFRDDELPVINMLELISDAKDKYKPRHDETNNSIVFGLDDIRLYFLRVFYDERGNIRKFSIDVEAAADDHYDLRFPSAVRLARVLEAIYQKGGLIENLREIVSDEFRNILSVMDDNNIDYVPFHFG